METGTGAAAVLGQIKCPPVISLLLWEYSSPKKNISLENECMAHFFFAFQSQEAFLRRGL